MKQLYQLSLNKTVRVANLEVDDLLPFLKRSLGLLTPQAGVKTERKSKDASTVQLHLVSDAEIAVLNRDYRHKEGPTDVISLSYLHDEPFPGKNLAGEIFISVDTAKKQAKEHGKSLIEEIQFLFVHGLLHLFGYDHEKEAEKKVMFDLQDEILETLTWRAIIDP